MGTTKPTRLISLLLTLAMMLSIMPVISLPASAEGKTWYICQGPDNIDNQLELRQALDSAAAGDTIAWLSLTPVGVDG